MYPRQHNHQHKTILSILNSKYLFQMRCPDIGAPISEKAELDLKRQPSPTYPTKSGIEVKPPLSIICAQKNRINPRIARQKLRILFNRSISTPRLRTSLPLYLEPINLIIFEGSKKPNLAAGFALICFQRLSNRT